MAIDPTSPRPRLVGLPGGRVDEPPQSPWRFTPNERCKESLWRALMSTVLYGTFAHSLYRVFRPSDDEPREMSPQRFVQHLILEPMYVMMGVGIADLLRRGATGRRQNLAAEALLHPLQTFRDLFNNCIDREVTDGRALIAGALNKRHNPLRSIKFESIPFPKISAQDIAGIDRRQEEQRHLMETGALLAAGGAVAEELEGLSLSAVLVGTLGTLLLPFFVTPPAAENNPSLL